MIEVFMKLLRDARLNQQSEPVSVDFQKLYEMSCQHEVQALIYNQIYHFPEFPEGLKNQWKKEAIRMNAIQTIKTSRFLAIYKKFLEKNLIVLVVKGIVCRSLYPQPDNRPSNDEDLYVRQIDFEEVKRIFLDNKFILVEEGNDVSTFLDQMNGLSIELHTSLFSDESKAYGQYQQYFTDAFDSPAMHSIQGVNVYSLSHQLHFLFLYMHFVKHFLHGGVGIRQVMDMVMYIEKFGLEIDWKVFYAICQNLSVDVLFNNVLALASNQLGLDENKIILPDHFDLSALDYQPLLEDILDAGVFGKSSIERLHSSTITLNALESGKRSLLKSLFPSRRYFKRSYPYLQKYPFLLPVAWFQRIIHYIFSKESGDSQKTIEIGNQRIELLKKYQMMK